MALIVGGTTVTGTQTLDATKLTGDLPAISAANLTSVPGSTASSWKNVGSYVFAIMILPKNGDTTQAANTTYRFWAANAAGAYSSSSSANFTSSGTWRTMGYTNSYNYDANNTTLWHRIS
tara:strand:+ start:1227 stop:1586 length:360 start_codon:yes stop_codon:yes gene_type:complete